MECKSNTQTFFRQSAPISLSLTGCSVNPSGIFTLGAAVAFLIAVPITTYITAPGGVLQSFVETAVRIVPGTADIPNNRIVPALSALYIFMTFGVTGAASGAGQAMAREGGLDDNRKLNPSDLFPHSACLMKVSKVIPTPGLTPPDPRKDIHNLRGLPLRMRSAHYNLMEMFPGFALAAALTQSLAPGNQQLINLLGLHVLVKCFLYYPCYLLNIAPLRATSHVFATGSVINVCWHLATGAK